MTSFQASNVKNTLSSQIFASFYWVLIKAKSTLKLLGLENGIWG